MGKRTRQVLLPFAGVSVIAQVLATSADSGSQPQVSEQSGLTRRLTLSEVAHDGQNPVSQGSFSSSASVVVANGVAIVTARVRAQQIVVAVFDVELYGPTGARVDQQYQDNTMFLTGQEQVVTFRWTLPPGAKPGAYSVTIGLFQPGKEWGSLYHWNTGAGSFFLP